MILMVEFVITGQRLMKAIIILIIIQDVSASKPLHKIDNFFVKSTLLVPGKNTYTN